MSPIYERAVAVSLAVLALAAVVVVAFLPVGDKYVFYRETIADETFQLAKLRRLAAQRKGLEAQLSDLREHRDGRNYTLSQATPALASADLQQRVSAVIADSGGQLSSAQVVPAQSAEGGFERVAVRVQMSADVDALRAVLHNLETTRPLLVIDKLDIRVEASRRTRRRRASDAGPTESGQLRVSFEVAGFMRAPASG